MARDIEYWDEENTERLTHDNQYDAIEYVLDGLGELPDTLEICGYARMVLPKAESFVQDICERILESLDEEHSDPEGSYTEATDTMKVAAKVFAQVVLDEYEGWAYEIVKRETIDVTKWIAANRPDWLEEINGETK